MKDKVSVDGVRKEKERLTTDHQPIPGPYLSFHEKSRKTGGEEEEDTNRLSPLLMECSWLTKEEEPRARNQDSATKKRRMVGLWLSLNVLSFKLV